MRQGKAESGSVIFGIVAIVVLIGAGFFATRRDRDEAKVPPTVIGDVAEEAPVAPARDAAGHQ